MSAAMLMGLTIASAGAQTISRESRILAECEFIYAYTAQLMQLRNSSGAAISVLRRSTILSTANMISNAEDGKVPSWKIKIWTELRPKLKADLDSGKSDPTMEAARCDREAMPIALNVRNKNLQLWGHDFDGLQQQLLSKMRASTGI